MRRKIFYNGNVLTQDKQHPYATAFAVENGKIISVGDDSLVQLKNDDTEIIDLHNKTVLPGFHDAHIHIWKVGNLMTLTLDLRGVGSVEEMLDKIRDYHNKNPQLKWIQARGFNEANFPDKRIPNKYDLDKITTSKPICVTRTCAHQIIVNSKTLELAQLNRQTQAPVGGEIKYLPDGDLAGHFTETAIGLILNIIPSFTAQEYRHMILTAQNELIRHGITAACDPAVDEALSAVYRKMDAAGELKLRTGIFPIRIPDGSSTIYELQEIYHSAHLTIDTVKFFADGGLSGKTAALKKPYKNSQEKGVLRLDKELFTKLAMESQNAGFRIATHAIGDAAIEMVLDVYNSISSDNVNLINHRIEHLGLPSEYDLECMKELNVSAVMQPVFISELGKNFRNYLPDEYLQYVYPARSVLDHGINLAFSTDAPVVKNISPLQNIFDAISRKDSDGIGIANDQQINLQEAIYAYTMGSAIACGSDKIQGSVTAGKNADFVVLENYDPADITKAKVEQTFINGENQTV